jgi:hypothetical protein
MKAGEPADFVVLNPQVSDFFFEPCGFRLLRRRALKKYRYIFNRTQRRPILALVDASASGLVPARIFSVLPEFVRRLISRFEIAIWKRLNQLGDQVEIHYDASEIGRDRVLFGFACKAFHDPAALRRSAQHFRVCVFHLSHYHGFTREISAALRDLPNCHLAADVDISGAPLFQKFFAWYHRPVLVIPFEVAARFKVAAEFRTRQRRAVASGTFHRFEEFTGVLLEGVRAYREATGAETLHPIRRALFEAQPIEDIDCYIRPYYNQKEGQKIGEIGRLRISQRDYFKINIVDTYNRYMFAIIGEEFFNGLPGIGALEAMGCGCVVLARKGCYQKLGFKDEVHYVEYEGELPELRAKLAELLQADPAWLERISRRAAEHVNQHLREDVLGAHFAATIAAVREDRPPP